MAKDNWFAIDVARGKWLRPKTLRRDIIGRSSWPLMWLAGSVSKNQSWLGEQLATLPT